MTLQALVHFFGAFVLFAIDFSRSTRPKSGRPSDKNKNKGPISWISNHVLNSQLFVTYDRSGLVNKIMTWLLATAIVFILFLQGYFWYLYIFGTLALIFVNGLLQSKQGSWLRYLNNRWATIVGALLLWKAGWHVWGLVRPEPCIPILLGGINVNLLACRSNHLVTLPPLARTPNFIVVFLLLLVVLGALLRLLLTKHSPQQRIWLTQFLALPVFAAIIFVGWYFVQHWPAFTALRPVKAQGTILEKYALTPRQERDITFSRYGGFVDYTQDALFSKWRRQGLMPADNLLIRGKIYRDADYFILIDFPDRKTYYYPVSANIYDWVEPGQRHTIEFYPEWMHIVSVW